MGRMSRNKGARRELEAVKLFRSWGLHSEKVPLSGAAHYQSAGHDVDVYKPGRDAPFCCEVKGRKELPKWLTEYLGDNDILILKADRSEALYVLPERVLRELLTS